MCDLASHLHPFERNKLGQAPFRCIGMEEKTYCACPGAPIQPGSSCDYCGQGIRYVFWIESADRKRFKIGGDCAITQLSKASNSADKKLVSTIKKTVNQRKRELAKASAAARIERAKATLEGSRQAFEAMPHTNAKLAERGRTLADYLDWMFRNAGQTGRLKACKIIEAEAV
jgi:hypothetical protein